ncbi:MAG: Protein tyrosine/serine phosphatase [Candidatus Tokpelaia sp. JSC188]|nr:MAG: Protein tyrosine/serine phosphatase [Candidatus Tokpelaia sp. JSC188]
MSGLKHIGFALLAIILLLGTWMGIEQFAGNFHEVIPGEFYRSGQLKPKDIAYFHRLYNIRSIINLRDDISSAELGDEKNFARKVGIVFYHFPFSSKKILPVNEIEKLMDIMKQAPKPLLIHCNHGANRTGLAAAVYMAKIAGQSNLLSEWQLSPYYGHISLPIFGRCMMNKSWDLYAKHTVFGGDS